MVAEAGPEEPCQGFPPSLSSFTRGRYYGKHPPGRLVYQETEFFCESPMASDGETLQARLLAGDDSVFPAAFEAERGRLWRFVYFRMDRRIQGRVDPDDIVQEIYLAAESRLSKFVAGDFPSLFFWLRLVAAQTLSNVHRTHLGAQARSVHQEAPASLDGRLPDTSVSLSYHLIAHMTSPSQALSRDERAEQLHQALQQMSPLDREIIALRHFEELTNRETAMLLQLKPQAASIRYVRALERLQRILESLGENLG